MIAANKEDSAPNVHNGQVIVSNVS